jgi:peptidyl-prolyl cis-trans isomerase C
LCGCGAPPVDELVVARIGDQAITAAQLEEFARAIPPSLKEGDAPLETNRSLLESLIDKEILLREAQATRTENDPWFKEKLARHERDQVLRLYNRRQIAARVRMDPEEIEAHYRATGRHRALRFSGLVVDTREQAEALRRQIEAGADFHRLAEEHSLYRETAERGGDVGGYLERDQVSAILAEHLFALSVGQISAPIPHPFRGRTRYAVFKVLDEIPVPLAASEDRVREELFARKRAEVAQALMDSLKEEYAPRLHPDRVQLLVERSSASPTFPALPPEEGRLALCSYRGGHFTLGDFLADAEEMHANPHELTDSLWIAEVLHRFSLPQRFFFEEARSLGYHQDPQLLAELEAKRQELLIRALRLRQVDDQVSATEAEALAFYQVHPEKFTSPETTVLAEILVADSQEASRLKGLLQEGGDPLELARGHTIRQSASPRQGQLRLNMYNQSLFQSIYDAAKGLQIGEVGGPVRVGEGYSIFKVLDRVEEKSPYDAEAKRRALAYVKVEKAKRQYVRYVRGLRDRYPVEILEENLEKMSRTLSAAPPPRAPG